MPPRTASQPRYVEASSRRPESPDKGSGSRTAAYGYDAYGDYTYGSGGGTNLIGFRYTGEWLDGDSVAGNGYYKIGLRNYDPTYGRWTQTDPLHRATNPAQPSEANPYNYAGCNPVNQTDPSGACSDVFKFLSGFGGITSLKFSVLGSLAAKPALAGGIALSGAATFGALGIGLGAVSVASALACAIQDD